MRFTLCALLYGDEPELARRCLNSWLPALPSAAIGGIRLGLNAVGAETQKFVRRWACDVSTRYQVPIWEFACPGNPGKYPLMRQMLLSASAINEAVMWFDDDSYLVDPTPDFFTTCQRKMVDQDVIGQRMRILRFTPGQQQWVKEQPWYTGKPIGRHFPQGSWWCVRSEILQRWGWPTTELHHNGGDVMFGRLIEQQELRWLPWFEGVCLNCDEQGRLSKSPRRGLSQTPLALDYKSGDQPDLSYQVFDCWMTAYPSLPMPEVRVKLSTEN